MRTLRAWLSLVGLSLRRQLRAASTWIALAPLGGSAAVVWALRFGRSGFSPAEFNRFSQFLIYVFVSAVVPLVALALGTSGVGGDREDRTLLFLLVRPLPRPLVLLAKTAATLPLAVGLVAAGFWVHCALASGVGPPAWNHYLAPVVLAVLAYLGLFQLLAVAFRHGTVVALVYALFIELFLGNVPGIIKRVAVNYYGRSLMYTAGGADGLVPPDPQIFEPISVAAAELTLLGFALLGLLAALAVFQFREYRDLS